MSTADVAFAIGTEHLVCEDYGLAHSGAAGERSFVALADGCSSSADTDIGARLLCHAVARRFRSQACALRADPEAPVPTAFSPRDVIHDADAWRSIMRLPVDVLDATVAVVFENQSNAAEVALVGDGVVAARRRDGAGIDYAEVTCAHNAPTYLSYFVKHEVLGNDGVPLGAYQAAGGGVRFISTQAVGCERVSTQDHTWTEVALAPDGEGPDLALSWIFDRDRYDAVAVMTDGVSSFRTATEDGPAPVPSREVIAELMTFKSATPGFAKRRLRRFLTRHCAVRGWRNHDDVGIAALALDPVV